MIHSKEEFARIWKKEPAELSQLDYFAFKLINHLERQLSEDYFSVNGHSEEYNLNPSQVSELAVQLTDGLQFFFEQICFGKGCALGCPNKLDTPFSEMEDETRFEIIETEFQGNAAACKTREDCFKHDLVNYVIKDTIIDFLIYFTNTEYKEDDPEITRLANFLSDTIVAFTVQQGPGLLKEPFKKADSFVH